MSLRVTPLASHAAKRSAFDHIFASLLMSVAMVPGSGSVSYPVLSEGDRTTLPYQGQDSLPKPDLILRD